MTGETDQAPRSARYWRLPREHREDLRWYVRAQHSLDMSPMARMLERAELFAARECPGCHGTGFVQRRGGRARAVSAHERMWREALDLQEPIALPPALDETCPRCSGIGALRGRARLRPRGAVTARPTGSSVPRSTEASVELTDVELVRMARVPRRLSLVAGIHEAAAEALVRVHDADHAETLTIWHLTAAGQTLLRRNRDKAHPTVFFDAVCRDARLTGDTQLGLLIAGAEAQARELVSAGNRLYLVAAGDVPLDELTREERARHVRWRAS